jgi:hypothetical protein
MNPLGLTQLRRLEAHHCRALCAALVQEWVTFATHTRGTSDRGRAVFDVVLAPFPPEALEEFCAMFETWAAGSVPVRPNLPLLWAVVEAFRQYKQLLENLR